MRGFGELQAFTSAVLGGENDLDKVVDAAAEAENFKHRVQALLPDSQLSNAALAGGVLVASVAAVAAIGFAIHGRLQSVDDERANFWEMVKRNSVGFLVLESESDRNPYGNYVAEFIRRLEENPRLYALSGLKRKTVDTESTKGTLYIASCIPDMPFIARLAQPEDDGDHIDESLQFLMFFLYSKLGSLLKKTRSHVKDKFLNDINMFFKGREHVQWVNSTGLVGVISANIALAIGFGVKPNSNTLYTFAELKQICEEFRSYLLNMRGDLIPAFKDNRHALCESAELDEVILQLTERINHLGIAYSKKLQNDLNLGDLVSSSYALLHNTTRPIRRLLYPGGRLENPAEFFTDLINLKTEIELYPDLLSRLVRKLNMQDFDVNACQVNSTPVTVMDLLVIYANNFRSNREAALKKFKREQDKTFVDILRDFDKNYIQPVEDNTGSYNMFGHSNVQTINPAAEFLICFISLMLESHNVSLLDKREQFKSSNEQAAEFLLKALGDNARYRFSYFFNDKIFKLDWKEYFRAQINLLFEIRHLSFITTLTNANQRYLQRADFQRFLLQRLARLRVARQNFSREKDLLIARGQRLAQQSKFESIIVSEINAEVPQKNVNLEGLLEVFDHSLIMAEQTLNHSTFDENARVQELHLIERARSYDLYMPADPLEVSNKERFYKVICDNVLADKLVAELEKQQGQADAIDLVDDDSSRARSNSMTSVSSDTANAHFRLQVYDTLLISSVVLLVLGIVALLLCMFALPHVSFLSSRAISGIIIGGFTAIGVGSLGMGSSYLVPRFFDKKSELIPVVNDEASRLEFVN